MRNNVTHRMGLLVVGIACLTLLTGCSKLDVTDASALKEAVTKAAQDTGGTKLNNLTVYQTKDGGNGNITIVKDDQSTEKAAFPEAGEVGGSGDTITPALSLEAVPYPVVAKAIEDAVERCGGAATVNLYSTMTNGTFVDGSCDGVTSVVQYINDTRVPTLDNLDTSASLDQAINEAKLLVGPKAVAISLSFTSALGDEPFLSVEAPQAPLGNESCTPSVQRRYGYIKFVPELCIFSATDNGDYDLNEISGTKLAAALTKAKTELGITTADGIQGARVARDNNGKLVLNVLKAGDAKQVFVPIT